jgi:hypothetical protein
MKVHLLLQASAAIAENIDEKVASLMKIEADRDRAAKAHITASE